MNNNYQPTGVEQTEKWNRHQDMLREHAAVKQERVERMRKERFQGKKRAYPGHLY